MAEIGCMGPLFEVGGCENTNDKLLSVRDHHSPFLGFGVPDDLWVPKLSALDGNDRILGILCEGVAAIPGISNLLSFLFCGIERVNSNDSVFLIREEATGIIYIDYRRAGENPFPLGAWEDGNRLVFPVIKILRSRMPPMLVSCDNVGRIV